MAIEIVSDASIAAIADRIDFFGAVRQSFIAAAAGEHRSAPVLRASGLGENEGINLKFGAGDGLVGGKIGTYWSGNAARGGPNHAATTFMLDPETGYLHAILSAALLNRLRTAAGDAVAVDALARPDAGVLALIGAGAQAPFEARAVAKVRLLTEIRIAARDPGKAARLAEELAAFAPRVVAMPLDQALDGADIVITSSAARSALVREAWIAPGTHISAMGADAKGKQELDPALLASARLFADLPEQSIRVGEFQHAAGAGIIAIGDVLAGTRAGRQSAQDITIFDSSGLALQDLFVARAALGAARTAKLVQQVEF